MDELDQPVALAPLGHTFQVRAHLDSLAIGMARSATLVKSRCGLWGESQRGVFRLIFSAGCLHSDCYQESKNKRPTQILNRTTSYRPHDDYASFSQALLAASHSLQRSRPRCPFPKEKGLKR